MAGVSVALSRVCDCPVDLPFLRVTRRWRNREPLCLHYLRADSTLQRARRDVAQLGARRPRPAGVSRSGSELSKGVRGRRLALKVPLYVFFLGGGILDFWGWW